MISSYCRRRQAIDGATDGVFNHQIRVGISLGALRAGSEHWVGAPLHCHQQQQQQQQQTAFMTSIAL